MEREYGACLSAGRELQGIAKEYSAVKKEIEAKTWAVTELQAIRQHQTL